MMPILQGLPEICLKTSQEQETATGHKIMSTQIQHYYTEHKGPLLQKQSQKKNQKKKPENISEGGEQSHKN